MIQIAAKDTLKIDNIQKKEKSKNESIKHNNNDLKLEKLKSKITQEKTLNSARKTIIMS